MHPGLIPCQAGCSACCRGPFDISVADAALVVEAVIRLPLAIKRDVAARAREQVQSMHRQAPEWGLPFDIGSIGDDLFDSISDAMADVPCSLLDSEGRCLIYADRPMVCRMIGVGMATESGAVIPNACPIQDQFPGYAELEPVPFGLEEWETAENREKMRAALHLFGTSDAAEYETTVAGAVVLALEGVR